MSARIPSFNAQGQSIHCHSPLKGEETDSDDETSEVDLTGYNAENLYAQWQRDPQSLKIRAYVQTRNPFCPFHKLRQAVELSPSESYVDETHGAIYLRFYPIGDQTVYYSYNQDNRYSSIKILLNDDHGQKKVVALEKIFISTPYDKMFRFSSLNGRMKAEVTPLQEGEVLPLIRSAFQELQVPDALQMAFVLNQSPGRVQNIHALKSLVYRIKL